MEEVRHKRPAVSPVAVPISRLCALSRACLILSLVIAPSFAAELAHTIDKIRPSIVGVGTHIATRNPTFLFRGTGFVVGDGLHVITNAHVLPTVLDTEKKERLIIAIGRGTDAKPREAERVVVDQEHDLVLLRIRGEPLPALALGDSDSVREGQSIAFTGFPIGVVLGLYPVTHRGIVSALTPIIIPGPNTRDLDPKAVKQLRSPFQVFQLDATAYPGNSGSPLFDPETGAVLGVINMVFVKESKEKAITEPSGISYAIPVAHVRNLLSRRN